MKFSCKVSIAPISASGASYPAPKPSHSTVGLGHFGPDKKDSKGNVQSKVLFLKICSDKNKSGSRYKVTSNVRAMFYRFAASQGRATVGLHQPKIDIHISEAPPGELCQLLSTLRLPADKQQKLDNLSSLADLAVAKKPVRRLQVADAGEYQSAIQDLPSSLEKFVAISCALTVIDTRILQLSSLCQLNLSKNCLTKLPEVHDWPKGLQNLDLSGNQLSTLSRDFCNSSLRTSLVVLNLSGNSMKRLPEWLCCFESLAYLDISHNGLVELPHYTGSLTKLRELDASDNHLVYLPQSLSLIRIGKLSIAGNRFPAPLGISRRHWPSDSQWHSVPSLMEKCAICIVSNRIPYKETMPWMLKFYLDSADPCLCGRPTFSSGLRCVKFLPFRSLATGGSYDPSGPGKPVQVAICSKHCYEQYQYQLYPTPPISD